MSELLFNFIGFSLLGAVAIVLILGIYTLFKGGSTSKKYSNKLIDEVKTEYKLPANKIILCGFSQGCMISLQTGLKREDKINSVIGYSGKIIDIKHIENNIKSRPDIILMHGEKDEVVPVSFLLEAIELFNRIDYKSGPRW